MFNPGQHVVCIDDRDYLINLPGHQKLVKGTVYTIRTVTGQFAMPAVMLEEFPPTYIDPDDGQEYEGWYRASRFRPLQKLNVEDFLPAVISRETENA